MQCEEVSVARQGGSREVGSLLVVYRALVSVANTNVQPETMELVKLADKGVTVLACF